MKKTELNRFLPFEADYTLLNKLRSCEKIMLVTIAIFSVILPILNYYSSICINIKRIYTIINFLYFASSVIYYILNIYTETFLYPATARKRRKGFIDNSLGSKFLTQNVKRYYTNDNLKEGPYKMLINCFENCFFTLNIAKGMIAQILIKNIALFILLLGIAYCGMRNNLIAIPIVQILLSTLFLTELIHHINFIAKLEQLYEKFIEVVASKTNMNSTQTLQESVLLFLDYETTLAYNKAPLSDKVYEKLNEKLSNEWEDIKIKYDISKNKVHG